MSEANVTRDEVMEALGRVVTRSVRLTALADDMGLRKQHYASLRKVLGELVADGRVQNMGGGAYALVPQGRANDKTALRRPPRPVREGNVDADVG
jgi:hypothetical protein